MSDSEFDKTDETEAKVAQPADTDEERSSRPLAPSDVKLRGVARTLAKAGYGTRRQAEEMVRAGRVQVAGKRVLDPGYGVRPHDEIRIDGERVVELIRNYLAFNKPLNVATRSTVSHRTQLITEFLPRDIPGLAPAGRLDTSTSGLLLVSNDSTWNALAASGHGFDKEFVVDIDGRFPRSQIKLISAGVQVPKTGLFKPVSIELEQADSDVSRLRIVLTEGKVRHIRNLMTALRMKVRSVHRERIGPIGLDGMSYGRWRALSSEEIAAIRSGASRKDVEA